MRCFLFVVIGSIRRKFVMRNGSVIVVVPCRIKPVGRRPRMALGKRPVRGQVIPCRLPLAISRTTTATFVNLNFARGFDID